MIIQTKTPLRFNYRDGSPALELKVGEDNEVDESTLLPYIRTKLARLQAAGVVSGYEYEARHVNLSGNPPGRETLEDMGGRS